jgi:hypothetical protein
MSRDQKSMPDVPGPDFAGAVSEIWLTVNYAYRLACTRVYLQTRAMRTPIDELLRDEQATREQGQVGIIIWRSHLAAFCWPASPGRQVAAAATVTIPSLQ